MTSTNYETSNERLADLLNTIADIERKVEITRQVLVENRDFDAVEVFKHLDIDKKEKISKMNLLAFFEKNDLIISSKDLNMLFEHLDRDSDGSIDWDEYIKTVISKDCSFYENSTKKLKKDIIPTLPLEIRHSLTRVFEEELNGLKELNRKKVDLVNLKEFSLVQSFKDLDINNKSYIDIRDINQFISYYKGQITYTRAERILRRLDFDLDGKINYSEWELGLRPRCLGGIDVIERVVSDDAWILEQRIKHEQNLTAERVRSKYGGGREKSLDIHESRVNISPSRVYVRSERKRRYNDERQRERRYNDERQRNNGSSFSKSRPKVRVREESPRRVDIIRNDSLGVNRENLSRSPSYIVRNERIVTSGGSFTMKSMISQSPAAYTSPFRHSRIIEHKTELGFSNGPKIRTSTPERVKNPRQQEEIEIKVFKSPTASPSKKARRPNEPLRNLRRDRSPRETQGLEISILTQKNTKPEIECLSPEKEDKMDQGGEGGDYKLKNRTSKYSSGRRRIEEAYSNKNDYKNDYKNLNLYINDYNNVNDYNDKYNTPHKKKETTSIEIKKYELMDKSTTAGKLRTGLSRERLEKRPFELHLERTRNHSNRTLNNTGRSNRTPRKTITRHNQEIYRSKEQRERGYTSSPYKNLDYERLVRSRERKPKYEEKVYLEGFFNNLESGDRNELINSLKELLDDNKELEEARIQLSLRFDLNLSDLFNVTAGNRETAFVNSDDLYRLMKELNMARVTIRDAELLLERFDKNKDSFLDFSEFKEIFSPFDFEYRTPLLERSAQGYRELRDYTGITRNQLKELLEKILTAEKNLDFSRALVHSRLFSLFKMMDVRYQGLITVQDLSEALEAFGLRTSRKELCGLIDKFDYDYDGMISFEEFIEFFMPRKVSTPIKRPGRLY